MGMPLSLWGYKLKDQVKKKKKKEEKTLMALD